MLYRKSRRRAIAVLFLLIMLVDIFSPVAAYALTSGATQPEATSFEPIDTTDMVNEQTGDFTYNVPLLEVPGPEGGYPLSLSYHADIQPNVEASWVGLGWTLNPGSIDRNVNGYPDDWYNPSTTSHVYWAGGSTTTYQVGISIGIANTPATVSFGLSFAHDTYRGFGVGFDESIGWKFQLGGIGGNASVGFGINPYGGSYMSAGIGVTAGPLAVGVSVATNFKSLSAGFTYGLNYDFGSQNGESWGGTLLGSTISTGGGKPSTSIAGLSSSISNSKSGQISTSSHGWHVDIPVYYGINLSLGYSKVRYWTDETTSVTTWGSLNNLGSPNGNNNGEGWDNMAYDEYSLLEDPSYLNSALYPDPTIVQGGSFPDFDQYNVNAQGLGGSMRPYMFEGRIANQNIYNGSTPLVTYYLPGVTNYNPFFRFEGDFSNSYRQNENPYPNPALDLRYVVPPLDGIVYGNGDANTGYAYGNNLAGSKHVDIGPTIHPRHSMGYTKGDKYQGYMIEGFSITNESGVTYHFGLPAYTSGEQDYQEKIDQSGGATGNRVGKPNQYAYTWYLTTITGPDFVDRNGNGIADDGDWGYWVDFEYGKWANTYNWRNPGQGFQRDQDPQWQDVSMGTREVYYLNAIRTRTHVALFEKDVRNDAKGASPESFNTVSSGNIASAGYANQGLYNVNSSQSLRLSHIYLLNASDENFVTPSSGNAAAYQPAGGRQYLCNDCEQASYVLDRTDVDAVGRHALEAKAIRVIDFNYDYSLCPNTVNSFDINNPGTLSGKLTLLNFVNRGKGGANLLPPMTFSYDLTGTAVVSQTGNLSPTNFVSSSGTFNVGDMLMESGTTPVYCGIITDKLLSAGLYRYTLTNGNYTGGTVSATLYTTKNPPYVKDAFDSWGNYKGDYNLAAITANENLGRITTPTSAAAVDAWSLRTITSQMGGQIQINYGSDQIAKSALNTNYTFAVNSLALDGDYSHLKFNINTYGYPLANILQQGNVGNIVIMTQCNCVYPPCYSEYITEFPVYKYTYTINSIGATDNVIHVTLNQPIPSSFTDPASPPGDGLENFSQLITANISAPNSILYGGGLHVNSITKVNGDGSQDIVSYNYNDPSTGLPSGVTSFMPSVMDADDPTAFTYLGSYLANIAENSYYKPALNSDVNFLCSIGREVPAPAVIYQYVTVTNQVKNPDEASTRTVEGSTLYQFETYDNNMVGIVDVTPRTGPVSVSGVGNVSSRNLAMMKFTGSVGNLKRMVQMDANGHKLSETVNHYLHDNLANLPLSSFMQQYKTLLAQYNYQGYLQERYYEVKQVSNQSRSGDNGVKATISAREEYPCIQTGQTVINYVNGTQTSSTNLAFDFYSGAVTKTMETDAYGNNVMTQTIPAYQKYPTMGLKINNDAAKNMLTQTAETYSWKVDATGTTDLGLISASATTWSDGFTVLDPAGNTYTQNGGPTYGDAWRPQSIYNWISSAPTTDGTTPVANFTEFNWSSPASSNSNWKNISNATLYDVYSKEMEASDINNVHSAMHFNYGDQKVILTGTPANFYEIAYSGAEDANINQTNGIFVNGGSGTIATGAGVSHTGAQSLLLNSGGTKGFTYSVPTANLVAGRTYLASVWVKPVSGSTSTVGLYYDIDGTIKNSASSSTSTKSAGGWTLVNLVINGSDISGSHTLNVWCRNDNATVQAYADDFRFQPQNAVTKAYVYDPFSGELDFVLDNNNLYTGYVYDGAGRLTAIAKEKLNVGVYQTNQYAYNYGVTQYSSAAINTNFSKNNCTANLGDAGIPMNVTVPAGMFTSYLSQADADARARSYAQDYANIHGSCSCQPGFSYASGLQSTYLAYTLSGTTVNFTYVFGWPSGYTQPNSTVTVGNINGSCGYPTATRTIPIYVSGTTYNVTVSPYGVVQVQLVSGPVPVAGQTIGLTGVFDLAVNSFYSAQASGTYQRNNCPSGQVGSNYTYTVIPYQYSSTVSQAAANALAQNDVNANGQNTANVAGTCNPACGFTYSSNISYQNSASFTTNGTSVTFSLYFQAPSNSYTGGTIGTISGACLPATSFNNMQVTDQVNPNRVWLMSVTSAGVVSISLMSNINTAPSSGGQIILGGTYNLSQ